MQPEWKMAQMMYSPSSTDWTTTRQNGEMLPIQTKRSIRHGNSNISRSDRQTLKDTTFCSGTRNDYISLNGPFYQDQTIPPTKEIKDEEAVSITS